jgi:hypothetical protein
MAKSGAMTTTAIAFHDGYGRPAGHRPGYCIPTDSAMVRRRALVRDAYARVAERDANAWRNPRPWGGAAALPTPARPSPRGRGRPAHATASGS